MILFHDPLDPPSSIFESNFFTLFAILSSSLRQAFYMVSIPDVLDTQIVCYLNQIVFL